MPESYLARQVAELREEQVQINKKIRALEDFKLRGTSYVIAFVVIWGFLSGNGIVSLARLLGK